MKSLVAEHLLCNATVQTLNGSPFCVHTMIDSGSQSSLISEEFVLKHQLSSIPLRPAIPICGLDGRPLSRGLITHITMINVKIGDHSEVKTFSIINMPWDLLLGVDWLQTHNPVINWKSSSICFSCCDSRHLGIQFTTLAPSLDSDSINITMLLVHEVFSLGVFHTWDSSAFLPLAPCP